MPLPLSRARNLPAPVAGAPERAIERAAAAATGERIRTDPFVEEFRVLAMNILSLLEDTTRKAITVFSHRQGDGRTRIAVELSRALAEHTDVLLIGAQHAGRGFEESLLIPGPDSTAGRRSGPSTVLPPAYRRLQLSSDPRAVPVAGDVWTRIDDAMASGMMVVIDPPAAEIASDAFMLAQRSKNVLYVMRNKPQDMTPHRRAIDHLSRLNARVLGMVLNDR